MGLEIGLLRGRDRVMAHDVFLSYSSKDKTVADAVCHVLEGRGVRVWMAPRDILAGVGWAKSIIGAINGARVMVLVFSGNANTSAQIEREVERAVNKGVPIVPFRIEDVPPSEALEYFISAPHWLDAFTEPMEQHLERLAEAVKQLLATAYMQGKSDETASQALEESVRDGNKAHKTEAPGRSRFGEAGPAPQTATPTRPAMKSLWRWAGAGAAAALAVGLGAAMFFAEHRNADSLPSAQTVPPPPAPPAHPVSGVWDVAMSCPQGSAVNEYGALFTLGRYARAFKSDSVSGTTELALGYVSEDTVRLTGYVVFDQTNVYTIDAEGKRSGASFLGSGRFGSSANCTVTITEKSK